VRAPPCNGTASPRPRVWEGVRNRHAGPTSCTPGLRWMACGSRRGLPARRGGALGARWWITAGLKWAHMSLTGIFSVPSSCSRETFLCVGKSFLLVFSYRLAVNPDPPVGHPGQHPLGRVLAARWSRCQCPFPSPVARGDRASEEPAREISCWSFLGAHGMCGN
jgi:hypothetical protein